MERNRKLLQVDIDGIAHLALEVNAGSQGDPAAQIDEDNFGHTQAKDHGDARHNLCHVARAQRVVHEPAQGEGNGQCGGYGS